MTRSLDVYLEGFDAPIGYLDGDGQYALTFRYDRTYLKHAAARPLSLNLPLTPEPYGDISARAFFENLLFEGGRLQRLAERKQIPRNDVAQLLAHLGQECPGALSVVPRGDPPAKRPGVIPDDYRPLSHERFAEHVRALYHHREPDTDARISLAGVQDKMALVRSDDGHFYESPPPLGAPTTHILKVGHADYPRLVENEFLCLALARELGLSAVNADLREADGIPYLLVERFDRERQGRTVTRLHQEDGCQALGLLPGNKYEKDAHSRASAALGSVVKATRSPASSRQALIQGMLFHYLVGNADAHHKNIAVVYRKRKPELAPLYDVVSTAMYDIATELALSIGGEHDPDHVAAPDWHQFLYDLGITTERARDHLIANTLHPLAAAILPTFDAVAERHRLEHAGRPIRNIIGERLDNLNETFDWAIAADTDAAITTAPAWRLS